MEQVLDLIGFVQDAWARVGGAVLLIGIDELGKLERRSTRGP